MTLHSMTGFGEARAELGGWRVTIEIKTVNHKALDVRVNLPGELSALEPALLQHLRGRLARGRVSVHVALDAAHTGGATLADLSIDETAFHAVAAQLGALVDDARLSGGVTLGDMLTFRRLFERRDDAPRATAALPPHDQLADALRPTLDDALDALIRTRATEGATIATTLSELLDAYRVHLAAIEARRPQLIADYQQRQRERLDELTAGLTLPLDEQRLAQELAIILDRSDIAEEIQRAHAHLDRLDALVAPHDESEPLGKKIDFYLQEMIRETNTMGSKSNLAELTEHIIQMKSIVEQMREQAANIE